MEETTDAGQIDGTEVTEEVLAEEQMTDDAPAIEPQEEDNGKAGRLESEVAGYRKVLDTLGIDPDSDVAQKVMAGVVSKEDLVRYIAPQPQVVPQPEQTDAPLTAAQKLEALLNKVDAEDPTQDDFKDSLRIINELVHEQETAQIEQRAQENFNKITEAMLAPIMDDSYHKELPDELKAAEERLFTGGTDYLVGEEARKSPNPQMYLNPKTYGFYAEQNKELYDKLREHYINVGRQQERAGIQKPQPQVQPVAPSVGGTPVTAPTEIINLNNMRQKAQEYLNQAKLQ
jgi:hypothetical protein